MTLRRTVVAALAGALIVAGCSELGTDPGGVVAIELKPPAMPAVVVGDTLRDTTGAIAPLTAVVLNADGDTVAGAPVRFFVLSARDSAAVTVDSVSGIVTGDSVVSTSVRIIAMVSGLQPTVNLLVTNRPDTVTYVNRTADTVAYSFSDTTKASANDLAVLVASGSLSDPSGDTTAVAGWIVSYQILYNGVPDTTFAAMVLANSSTRSLVDTTSATGIAGRAVLAKWTHLPGADTDSVTVRATVKYHGVPVPGSPLDFNVIIRPQVTPAP
jgi:hypothetical protein